MKKSLLALHDARKSLFSLSNLWREELSYALGLESWTAWLKTEDKTLKLELNFGSYFQFCSKHFLVFTEHRPRQFVN